MCEILSWEREKIKYKKHLEPEVIPRHSYGHFLYLRSDGKNEWTIRARKVKFGKYFDNKMCVMY